MLVDYYSIKTFKLLDKYYRTYIPLVLNVAKQLSVDLTQNQFQGDHLGLQAISKEEFDICHKHLSNYSKMTKDGVIHNRRNRVYEFNKPLSYKSITTPRIEIFEPKPGADIKKLKPGIEHIAFLTNDYDSLLDLFHKKDLPIDKEKTFEDKSKFFKTKLTNLVEIEFRNTPLI